MSSEDSELRPKDTSRLQTFLVTCVALAGASCLFFWRVMDGTEVFMTNDIQGSDFWHYYFPLKKILFEASAEGTLPLWTSQIATGIPIHAAGEAGALYPPSALLSRILPLVAGFNWSVIVHFWIAGLLAAFYARECGARLWGAVFAGVIWAFGGFFLVHIKHYSVFATASWIPGFFWALQAYARTASRWAWAGLALCVTMSFLGGYPQLAYYTLLLGGLYALSLAFASPVMGFSFAWKERRIRWLAFCAVAIFVGLGLAAAQLFPTLELSRNSVREGGLSLDEAFKHAYHWDHLRLFLQPKAFGDPAIMDFRDEHGSLFWEVTGYVGILPLVLLPIGLFVSRSSRGLVFFAALALLLALGKYGFIAPLFHRFVPGFDLFRFHNHFIVFTCLWGLVMAGFALDRLGRGRRWAVGAGIVAVALTLVDLYIHFRNHNPTMEAKTWLSVPESVEAITKLEEERGASPFRTLSADPVRTMFQQAFAKAEGWSGDLTPYVETRNMIEPNMNVAWDVPSLGIYLQLFPQRIAFLVPTPGTFARPRGLWLGPGARPMIHLRLLSVFNVRYILSRTPLHPSLIEKGQYAGDIKLYENPFCMPRAFMVPRAERAHDDPERTMDGLLSDLAQLRSAQLERVWVEPVDEASWATGADERVPITAWNSPVQYEEISSSEVRLTFEAPAEGWLFVSDTWYPGWKATLDGEEVPLHRANIVGRAVAVPEGEHEIVMTYEPRSVTLGIMGSLTAMVFLLGWVIFHRRLLGRRGEEGQGSTSP